jgi:trigger factor
MKITKQNLPKSRIKLTVEVPAEETDKYFAKAYEKLAPSVEIKGFRPGQAPKLMVLESIGYGRYSQTALDIALPEVYYQAITEEKIIPVQPPAISVKEFNEGTPFIFDAEVDIVPEIKLCDYKKIHVKHESPKFEVKKEELDKILERLRYQNATFLPADKAAEEKDRIEIDFEGSIDGVVQENMTSKNHPLILGEGVMIPGFEKELVGMKKGDEREFDIDVPDAKDKNKKKRAHFKVKMVDIKQVVLPEIDGAFALKFGHEEPEQLIKAISEKLLEEKKLEDHLALEKKVLDKVVSGCKIELPESLIEQEISRRLMQLQEQMGPGFPKYLENMGKKMEDIRKELRPSAELSAKTGIILGEIAKEEGLLKPDMKDHKEQEEVIRKTIHKLIDIATN